MPKNPNIMTPDEFMAAPKKLGLTLDQMAAMIGYTGEHRRGQVHKMTKGTAKITPQVARLVRAYVAGYRPDDWPTD